MEKETRYISILLLMVLTLYGGCVELFSKCQSYPPQLWHIGQMEAELNTFKPTLKVGDKMHFSFKLPKTFKDTLNREVNVDLGVQVIVKLSTTLNLSDTIAVSTSNNNFFAVDTTIFHVFNQYFETKNITGNAINAYTFAAELNNGVWEIETEYITKKAGNYWASIYFKIIDTSVTHREDICMLGDTQTFGAELVWKQSDFNRIDVLFNDKKEKYPEYYGFMVEE